MAEAGACSVDIETLQAQASKTIAALTGAESGYVTSGASAGLLLATSACLAGLDPARMAGLPGGVESRNEVLVARGQRNSYDHAVRAAGAQLVEIGLPDRGSGAGVRDTEAWEYDAAITNKTAAILYTAGAGARPSVHEVAAVAQAARIPVIVDAAAELPPQSNLQAFIEAGADLVIFSGGKAIGGPQASGILCGRRDLIMSAALQHLDMDVLWDLWSPPSNLIDKSRLGGLPRHGIGRSCKVGKEEIAGLLTALDLFVAEGDAVRHARWLTICQDLASGLPRSGRIAVDVEAGDDIGAIPKLVLGFPADETGKALELIKTLLSATPAIHTDIFRHEQGLVVFNPICLRDGDTAEIIRRVGPLLD